MKDQHSRRAWQRLIIFVTVLCAAAVFPLLSRAQPSNSITITNNSGRTIRYVYFSHANADDWTANQLGTSTIGPGQSYTLNNVSWDSSQIKVIGEDQDGCFVSEVVSYGADATWTVTNNTPADCGS